MLEVAEVDNPWLVYIEDFWEKGLVLEMNGFVRLSKLGFVGTHDLPGDLEDFCCDAKSDMRDALEVL